ncbi:MAG: dihydroorotate dehydrogenase electron transfer subunit [Elusimicrobia bacterium]|nr:dihydroorotate dehydrogenase electron transfer subunit [Elusimicrobiota bacterium]
MTRNILNRKATVVRKEEIADLTYMIGFEGEDMAQAAAPGQFFHIRINGKPLRRPISIYNCKNGTIEIVFRVRGEGTMALSKTRAGEELDVLGPLGNGFPRVTGPALFVAGGLGAAPLNYLAAVTEHKGTFIYGARKEADFIPLSGIGNHHEYVKVSEETDRRCVTDIIAPHVQKSSAVFAAGPRDMLRKVAEIASGASREAFVSWEERMGCGIGLCLACAVRTAEGYKRTCSDGPVFNIKDLNWDEC